MSVDQTGNTHPGQTGDDTPDYSALLGTITNADGTQKYTDVETALTSLLATQQHIQTLEQENRDYKESATSTQELYDMLNKGTNQDTQDEPTAPQAITADDVVTIINQLKTNELKLSNKDKVLGDLATTFGSPEAAATEYTKKAQELNVSVEFLDSIASSSPAAVLAYFAAKPADMGAQPTGTEGDQRLDTTPTTPGLKSPEKSLLSGAATSDVVDYWKQCAPE